MLLIMCFSLSESYGARISDTHCLLISLEADDETLRLFLVVFCCEVVRNTEGRIA